MRDIPIKEVLEYQKKFSENSGKAWPDGITGEFRPDLSKDMPFCYEALPYPPKVIYKVMEKLADEGYLEYGVSLRTAWLTEKGEEFLQATKRNT